MSEQQSSGADVVEQFRLLWERGSRPDVSSFLAAVGPLPPARLVAVLRLDQHLRWHAGDRVAAETYLDRFPTLRAAPDAIVDLAYGEFLLREELGERPDPEEYARRFPEHAAILRDQIGLHQALKRTATVTVAPVVPSGAGGPTAGYAPTSAPGEVVRAAVTEDVAPLLRRRLLVVFSIFAGVIGVANLAPILFGVGESDWWDFPLVGTWVGLVWLLASRRPLSLRLLRACELVGFGVLGAVWVWWTIPACDAEHLRRFMGTFGNVVPQANSISLLWFSLIAIYGTAVPNTWRRAAAVIGVMAVLPIALTVATWWFDPPPTRVQADYLFYLGFWMVLGAAVAIFGSHKVTQLRREVAEARRLGPYRLVRKLGEGGMGEVYLAEHSLLKRPCAVKFILPDRAGDPALLRRFEREVRATAGLTHPNTVQVFDYGHTPDGTFYYAMEYVPGLNLEELVRRAGPLPPGRVIHVLRQLCGALAEAHAAGLIHRDIKPGNVILGERGGRADVAKLLDFGLVTAPADGDDKLTRDGAVTGTPAYMSPEQAAGRSDLGPASDVYSLGALAHFLLTGRTLFPGRSAVQVLAAHIYETPDAPGKHRPDVPADLEAVVVRCLAKKPGDRFPDVAGLEVALAGCAAAGRWSPAEAADWWRSHPGSGEPRAAEQVTRSMD